jgi:hypothetical protein
MRSSSGAPPPSSPPSAPAAYCAARTRSFCLASRRLRFSRLSLGGGAPAGDVVRGKERPRAARSGRERSSAPGSAAGRGGARQGPSIQRPPLAGRRRPPLVGGVLDRRHLSQQRLLGVRRLALAALAALAAAALALAAARAGAGLAAAGLAAAAGRGGRGLDERLEVLAQRQAPAQQLLELGAAEDLRVWGFWPRG